MANYPPVPARTVTSTVPRHLVTTVAHALPHTGGNVAMLLLAAFLLFVCGSTLWLISR